jgi:hypothetical protein
VKSGNFISSTLQDDTNKKIKLTEGSAKFSPKFQRDPISEK